ncbi:hypothetical protein CPLU01_15029 [Colletotrichum plurivorum]|uniref:Uncharacterized protein n=1 Tax=Colletotrichum plurivorum TaxID=2175906 RepID=A0A8H6JF76_9PEZI|nr:hypothetical protein CPLU01_15029 [Colletotrichum plurivorum]
MSPRRFTGGSFHRFLTQTGRRQLSPRFCAAGGLPGEIKGILPFDRSPVGLFLLAWQGSNAVGVDLREATYHAPGSAGRPALACGSTMHRPWIRGGRLSTIIGLECLADGDLHSVLQPPDMEPGRLSLP